LDCNGTGKVVKTYTPFTLRKERKGIDTVRRSAGSFIATGGVGPIGGAVTYKEFKLGKMPEMPR